MYLPHAARSLVNTHSSNAGCRDWQETEHTAQENHLAEEHTDKLGDSGSGSTAEELPPNTCCSLRAGNSAKHQTQQKALLAARIAPHERRTDGSVLRWRPWKRSSLPEPARRGCRSSWACQCVQHASLGHTRVYCAGTCVNTCTSRTQPRPAFLYFQDLHTSSATVRVPGDTSKYTQCSHWLAVF